MLQSACAGRAIWTSAIFTTSKMMATDQPTTDVTWRSAASEQKFYFYYGCDMEKNRPIAERLDAAPDLLPIGEFIRNPE